MWFNFNNSASVPYTAATGFVQAAVLLTVPPALLVNGSMIVIRRLFLRGEVVVGTTRGYFSKCISLSIPAPPPNNVGKVLNSPNTQLNRVTNEFLLQQDCLDIQVRPENLQFYIDVIVGNAAIQEESGVAPGAGGTVTISGIMQVYTE